MLTFCTVCDKNYLLKGLALHSSLMKRVQYTEWTLHWLCLDMEIYHTLSDLGLKNIKLYALEKFEREDPELAKAKNNPPSKYGDAYSQYCWATTPYFINYILTTAVRPGLTLIYVDADLYFYDNPMFIRDAIHDKSIGIHTHRFSGSFNDDIDTGWYNVGIVIFRNDEIGRKASAAWKQWLLTTDHEYYDKYGTCGDQRYLNLFKPLFGKENVCVFDQDGLRGIHIGHLAPWNCSNLEHPRKHIIKYKERFEKVYFFHFSHFRFDLEKGLWHDSLKGEWAPARDPNIAPYYREYFEEIQRLAKEMDNIDVKCHCGAIIPGDEIDYKNGENEEGEEYGEVTARCPHCKAEYETSDWGEFDNKAAAKQCLSNYLKGNK